MSNTNWTEEQSAAIFTRNSNLLIAAGAGAGKTAVLVQRIIEIIMDESKQIDIDRLLVVTFTNAAAAEMRERIGEAISKKLDEVPEAIRLQRQLTLLTKANIITIHSFCLQVIRANYHKIEIDPAFRVCDETESILLKSEAVEDLFDQMFEEENNEEFLKLVEAYSGKDDRKLQNIVLDLHGFSMSTPWPKEWLRAAAEDFNIKDSFDFGKTKWAQLLLEDMQLEIENGKLRLEKAIKIIEQAEGVEYYLPFLNEDLKMVEMLSSCSGWEEYKQGFNGLVFSDIRGRAAKGAQVDQRDRAKKIRDDVKKKLLNIKEELIIDDEQLKNTLSAVYPLMRELTELTIKFAEGYSQKKKEKALIDFSDIEHYCLEILTEKDEAGNIIPTPVALGYREFFEEILIDEYQDSNLVQEVIMQTISRNDSKEKLPNLFMVGDVKQSIYRFRAAKPELFMQKYNTYSQEKGSRETKVKLFKNFRSRKEIIQGVNYLFGQIMSEKIGELQYDEEEALEVGASYIETEETMAGPIDVYIIEKNGISEEEDEEDEEADGEPIDNVVAEARLICSKINEIVNNSNTNVIYDKKLNAYRKATFRDIVVLMRATSTWTPVFVEEFNKAGIPIFADSNSGYFDTIEIKTIMCLLQIIDNPNQDIPMISVLRSPIVGLNSEQLIDIRLEDKEVNYYEAMKKSQESQEEIKEFISRLDIWRKKSIYMPLDEFIWMLVTETGYYGFVAAIPGGEQRQANLRILFERAKAYEKTSYKGLFNFINFITRLKNSSGDMGVAKILGENENLVRIMSIHKSKGLEFPIVVLAGCGKQFNLMDVNKNILYHSELGIGTDYIDIDRRISYPTVVKQILRKKIILETLSEEMRILYVALTRAKEKLIITGSVKNIEKTLEKWCEAASEKGTKLPTYFVLNSKCFLDWIGASIAKHEDGYNIREVDSNNICIEDIVKDKSKWTFNICVSTDLMQKKQQEEVDVVNEVLIAKNEREETIYKEEIHRILSWEYKFIEATKIPAKISVSELKREFEPEFFDKDEENLFAATYLKKPKFLEGKTKVTGVEKGSLMHLVMQHISLEKTSTKEQIQEEIKKLNSKGFIPLEMEKHIDIDKILNFFKSEIGIRMKKSTKVRREVPFKILMDSNSIFNKVSKEELKDEKMLLHGVIDCYFEEDGAIVIIDYKTDYVKSIEQVADRYKIQLMLYSLALTKITGKEVREKHIYLFDLDKSIIISE